MQTWLRTDFLRLYNSNRRWLNNSFNFKWTFFCFLNDHFSRRVAKLLVQFNSAILRLSDKLIDRQLFRRQFY